MALKDLISSAANVNEEVIEKIISSYVRYDDQDNTIVLTSEASKLSNKQKILVFLTANEGWTYVKDDHSVLPIAPKDMEIPLGIKGGSLRPTLRALATENLLRQTNGGYRILPANLPKIAALVEA